MRVLLIEDDATLGAALQEYLNDQDYAVDWLQQGEQALKELENQVYDLLVLDWNLPGVSGLEVLQQLRKADNPIPVLMLTARDDLNDRVAGLDAGADDYVVKPFDLAELAARIRAFRRRRTGLGKPEIEAGPLVFDTVGREVRCHGERIALSVRELSVLEMLMMRSGRVVTKQQIVNSLSAWDADFSENAVEVYVYRLRKRLEKTGVAIQTIRGFGYLLDVENRV
ncbi:response regulator transcription factor [Alcaligenes endophyticus]|uniref:Response regulator transcription factor n=1 Tax=Alcaligenes endophyticus TaxID=1929088 RepID=A0ABT8ELF1_9BURK|nr:response regulator transcription factor [Alcaligenes endophyticus]MCX5590609.1 response regulator transcription factor [Alcaligenes endophyticus]MDN4122027.1 response regulator transcription factor [Alcaligenes endophyticus]